MFLVLPEKQQNKIILKTKVNQIYAPESFEGKGSSFFQSPEYENEVQNMSLSYSPPLKAFRVILPVCFTYTFHGVIVEFCG